ncbi:MAG: 30S ribosomal protein S4 [Spirochaetes bacterium]|nr:30S ribosomal protein S4 [Spirochaetota bacterium]
MGRYTGPRCKQCRREMTPLMLKGQRCLTDKCPIKGKKKYPPGPPRKRRAKLSDYAVQLREKQRIRRSYGLLEKQFKLLFQDALRMKGVTGDNLMALLERRLDNVVYRMGFASSRAQARQLVKHKHVMVSGRIVDIPSYRVVEGNDVAMRENFASNLMLEDSIKLAKAIDSIPGWLQVDFEKRSGKVVRMPLREDLTTNFNDQLVVELYSK